MRAVRIAAARSSVYVRLTESWLSEGPSGIRSTAVNAGVRPDTISPYRWVTVCGAGTMMPAGPKVGMQASSMAIDPGQTGEQLQMTGTCSTGASGTETVTASAVAAEVVMAAGAIDSAGVPPITCIPRIPPVIPSTTMSKRPQRRMDRMPGSVIVLLMNPSIFAGLPAILPATLGP